MAYIQLGSLKRKRPTAHARTSQAAFLWLVWFFILLGLSVITAQVMIKQGPNISFLAWLLYFMGISLILYKPRYGLYLIVGLGLAGDGILSPWFPFIKNFSSSESIIFLHNAAIINPLETYLAATFLSWLIHGTSARKLHIARSILLIPAVFFLGFVIFGLFYGIKTGGNTNIAFWEVRPFVYLLAMLFLVPNLLETRQHISNLLWAAILGIGFEAITGNWYFLVALKGSLAGVQAISDHAGAIHMNTLFVFFVASLIYNVSNQKRVALGLMTLVALAPYFANQRRAAFLSLGVCLIVFAFLLFKEKRKLFWQIVPMAVLFLVAYIGVFWNIDGPLAIPVDAVKTVIAPSQTNAGDQSSNAYRDIENYNLHFTLRQKPLTGIGFGQRFYVVVPMPDISWFQWWQYFPHNSIIWIWLQTGAFGFFAFLYLFGLSIMLGARALRRMPPNELSAVTLTAVLYLVMHLVFAYVDIGWDSQSTLYLGAMIGLIGSVELIVSKPEPIPAKRWHWLPNQPQQPDILPLAEKEAVAKKGRGYFYGGHEG